MKAAHGTLTRRDWLKVSGLASGALAAGPARADISSTAPLVSPVSVAKVSGYDADLVAEFTRMFDQPGGIGQLVRGKTVAMKLNLSGTAGTGRRVGLSAGQTDWVHPSVVGALTAVFSKLGARRIRLLESTFRRRYGAPRPIDLAVLDGIETLFGGEDTGIPGVKHGRPGLLVAGRNCVSTDAVAMAAMGYDPRAGRHQSPFVLYKNPRTHPTDQMLPPGEMHQYADNTVLMGEAAGLGSADLGSIDVRGVPIREAMYDFEAHWKGQTGEQPPR